MRKKKGKYHYVESGLPDVYLEGTTIYTCSCGELMPEIPCVKELHRGLAETIVENSPRLSGPDRFSRKYLGFKAKDFAKLLGVSKVTMSRWENNKVKIDKSYEGMIRALVKSEEFRSVLKDISETSNKKGKKSHRYVIDPNGLITWAT